MWSVMVNACGFPVYFRIREIYHGLGSIYDCVERIWSVGNALRVVCICTVAIPVSVGVIRWGIERYGVDLGSRVVTPYAKYPHSGRMTAIWNLVLSKDRVKELYLQALEQCGDFKELCGLLAYCDQGSGSLVDALGDCIGRHALTCEQLGMLYSLQGYRLIEAVDKKKILVRCCASNPYDPGTLDKLSELMGIECYGGFSDLLENAFRQDPEFTRDLLEAIVASKGHAYVIKEVIVQGQFQKGKEDFLLFFAKALPLEISMEEMDKVRVVVEQNISTLAGFVARKNSIFILLSAWVGGDLEMLSAILRGISDWTVWFHVRDYLGLWHPTSQEINSRNNAGRTLEEEAFCCAQKQQVLELLKRYGMQPQFSELASDSEGIHRALAKRALEKLILQVQDLNRPMEEVSRKIGEFYSKMGDCIVENASLVNRLQAEYQKRAGDYATMSGRAYHAFSRNQDLLQILVGFVGKSAWPKLEEMREFSEGMSYLERYYVAQDRYSSPRDRDFELEWIRCFVERWSERILVFPLKEGWKVSFARMLIAKCPNLRQVGLISDAIMTDICDTDSLMRALEKYRFQAHTLKVRFPICEETRVQIEKTYPGIRIYAPTMSS